MGISPRLLPPHVSVKSVVIPFKRFPGSRISLGPEMRSTGEVMGIASQFGMAFAKAQIAAGHALPAKGRVFVSVSDVHKQEVVPVAQNLYQLGFELVATRGNGLCHQIRWHPRGCGEQGFRRRARTWSTGLRTAKFRWF